MQVEKRKAFGAGFGSSYERVLLLFTLASVILLGVVQSTFLYRVADPSLPFYFVPFFYTVGVAFIFGVAQLGYAFLARRRNTQAPHVYFLPGIPFVTYFLPTLGTALRPKEPPVNRDAWFDFNFIGPLLIFFSSFVLDAFAIGTGLLAVPYSSLPTNASVSENLAQLMISYVYSFLVPQPSSTPSFLSPLVDVATIGFTVVFLNLLPSFPFSGGNLVSTVFGSSKLKPLSYVSAVVLMLIDTPTYFVIAVLLLVLAGRASSVELADSVSTISNRRRILLIFAVLLLVISLPIPRNVATLPLG